MYCCLVSSASLTGFITIYGNSNCTSIQKPVLNTGRIPLGSGIFNLTVPSFLNDFGGTYLLLAIGVVLLDIVVLVIDLIAEGDSRKNLGGLPHKEYVVHVIANTLHYLAIALILVSKPLSAWELDAQTIIGREFPRLTELVALI